MDTIDKMSADGTLATLSKRERLQISRTREKLDRNLGSIAKMNRMPSALFVVDIVKEHIAVAEATKLGIPIFAMADTNSDPAKVSFPIPSNDDSSKSISKIMSIVTEAVKEGLADREQANAEKAQAKVDKKAAEVKASEAKVEETKTEETKVTKEK
jgi:small subunit ribosomal protein S2